MATRPKSVFRLDPTTVDAAKESAYQRRQSLNAWAQEAFDFYLAHLTYLDELAAIAAERYPEGSGLQDLAKRGQVTPATGSGPSVEEIRRRMLGSEETK